MLDGHGKQRLEGEYQSDLPDRPATEPVLDRGVARTAIDTAFSGQTDGQYVDVGKSEFFPQSPGALGWVAVAAPTNGTEYRK